MNGKLKAVLLLGVMYVIGVVSGVALQRYRMHRFWNPHSFYAEHRIKRLSSQLKLSPTQETAVREIFQKAHDRATQVNEEVSWDLADIHRDSVSAIEKILTPEQHQRFEKLHKEFHARHRHIPEDVDDSSGTVRATRS